MSDGVCPYLGVEDDPETAVAFPSPRNRCYRTAPPDAIKVSHQANHCLGSGHLACPIFLNAPGTVSSAVIKPAPAPAAPAPRSYPGKPAGQSSQNRAQPAGRPPKPAQPPDNRQAQPVKSSNPDLLFYLLAGSSLIAILIAALVIFPASGLMSETLVPTPTPTSDMVFVQKELAAASPLIPLPTETVSWTSTPTAAPENTENPTATAVKKKRQPTEPVTLNASETTIIACGPPSAWVQYFVKVGDTLSSLSRLYNVSINQLQSANCLGSSTTIYAGMAFYVPYLLPSIPTLAPTKAETAVPTVPAVTPQTPVPLPTQLIISPEPTEETQVPPDPEPSEEIPSPEPEVDPSPEVT